MTMVEPLTFSFIWQWRGPGPIQRDVEVTWRPPLRCLHYPMLYCGVYEFLRAPPDITKWQRAVHYLRTLQKCCHPDNQLQCDRIRWTQAWIDALADPECSDAETEAEDEEG